MKKKSLILKKKLAIVGMVGLLMVSITGCGMKEELMNMTTDAAAPEYYMDQGVGYENGIYDMAVQEEAMDAETAPSADGSTTKADVTTNRKLIRTVSMEVETEEFDSMVVNVESRVEELGGYIESAYTYNGSAYHGSQNRYAEMTVRVPDAELENFVEQVSGFSNVVSKTTSTKDITLEYVDTEGLKEMYIAEETSLLALLEKAETVEDISYLTARLSEVRYNIESLESRLLKYDDLVEYATIHLNIEEVEVYTPVVTEEKTAWEEISEGFTASVKDIWNSLIRFGINLLINLPYIIRFFVVIGLIILAIRLIIVIIKKVMKRKKAKKNASVLSKSAEQNIEDVNKAEHESKEDTQQS